MLYSLSRNYLEDQKNNLIIIGSKGTPNLRNLQTFIQKKVFQVAFFYYLPQNK